MTFVNSGNCNSSNGSTPPKPRIPVAWRCRTWDPWAGGYMFRVILVVTSQHPSWDSGQITLSVPDPQKFESDWATKPTDVLRVEKLPRKRMFLKDSAKIFGNMFSLKILGGMFWKQLGAMVRVLTCHSPQKSPQLMVIQSLDRLKRLDGKPENFKSAPLMEAKIRPTTWHLWDPVLLWDIHRNNWFAGFLSSTVGSLVMMVDSHPKRRVGFLDFKFYSTFRKR